MPIEAGQSKDVKLKVRPPTTIDAGKYPVAVRVAAEDATAKTDLSLDITGQPKLDITGREGLLSARATAGTETSIPVVITNSGTAPAERHRALRHGAERLEDHVRAQDHRPHRARTRTRRSRR